jgi:adenine C2-methylase RlmN of 23S rRNA A2503 and tRNA A37
VRVLRDGPDGPDPLADGAEIVGQWWAATWLLASPASAGEKGLRRSPTSVGEDEPDRVSIDNIVFMGMGEPLDNFDA